MDLQPQPAPSFEMWFEQYCFAECAGSSKLHKVKAQTVSALHGHYLKQSGSWKASLSSCHYCAVMLSH